MFSARITFQARRVWLVGWVILAQSCVVAQSTAARNWLLPPVKVTASAVDTAGNVYVTGYVSDDVVPVTPGAFQQKYTPATCVNYVPQKCPHAFVAKISSDGRQLLYATYLEGSGDDEASAITVDASGSAFVAGTTTSTDFPLSASAFRRTPAGGFVTRLSPDGTQLMASTYVAGQPKRLVLDSSGGLYVAGGTKDASFTTTPGAYQTTPQGQGDAFVMKIDPLLHAPVYSTLIGGVRYSSAAYGLFVDALGSAYVTGAAMRVPDGESVPSFPTTPGAAGSNFAIALPGAFVTRLSPDGSHPIFSAFLLLASASDIALDESGAVYVAGSVVGFGSYIFPVTNAGALGQGGGFATKFVADGSRFLYSTRLPGAVTQIVVIAQDHLLATGASSTALSDQVPTTPDSPVPCSDGSAGQYLLELNSAATGRVYGTYLNNAVIMDGTNVWSLSHDPNKILDKALVHPALQPSVTCVANSATFYSGPVAPGELVSIFGPGIGPDEPASLQLDASGKVATDLGGMRVFLNGVSAPLLYVSKNQINAVVPFETSAWTSTNVTVMKNGVALPDVNIPVAKTSPGFFKWPWGAAIIVNQDGTFNNPSHPAPNGSIVTLYGTGAGILQTAVESGSVGNGTTRPVQAASAQLGPFDTGGSFGGTSPFMAITYFGDAPTLVQGVVALNVQLSFPAYHQDTFLVINVGGYRTQEVVQVWLK